MSPRILIDFLLDLGDEITTGNERQFTTMTIHTSNRFVSIPALALLLLAAAFVGYQARLGANLARLARRPA